MWHGLSDLLPNLLASAIWAAVAAAGAGSLYLLGRANRRRIAGGLWRHFLSDTIIVLGVQARDLTATIEPSGLVGAGDIRALSHVGRRLEALRADRYAVKLAEDLSLDDWKSNLILIGGADSNLAVRQVLPLVTKDVRLSGDYRDLTLQDDRRGPGACLRLTWRDDGSRPRSYTDYGLIIFALNPSAARRHVLILAGASGHGTEAAGWRCAGSEYPIDGAAGFGKGFIETFVVDVIEQRPTLPRDELATTIDLDAEP